MSDENGRNILDQVQPAVDSMSAILAGRPPDIQSVILADLLAMWLCGFVVMSDPGATKRIRDRMLARHMKLVVDLIEAGCCEPKGGNN